MKQYSEFQSTRIDWLDKVPTCWKLKKIKHLANVITSNVGKKNTGQLEATVIHYGDVVKKDCITDSNGLKVQLLSQSEMGSFGLEYGDILLTKDSMDIRNIGDASIIDFDPVNTVSGYHIFILRSFPKLVFPKFLKFFFESSEVKQQLLMLSRGTTIIGLSAQSLSNLVVTIPDTTVQRAIVSYLEKEITRIDALIQEKQNFINLLEEKRQALVSHVVSSGLDDKVEMKESGVEWIEEVPKHWERVRLKHCMKGGFQNGVFKKSDEFGDGTLLINVSDVFTEDNEIHVNRLDRVTATKAELKKYLVEYGDIFFIRSSLKLEGIGMTACFLDKSTTEPVIFECHVVKGRPNTQKVLPEYLIKVLHSHQSRYQQIRNSTTTTMTTISQGGLGSALLFLPPIEEQKKIIKYIKDNTKKIDALNSETRRSISLLKEHRSALISAAVTGKIDVREEV